MERRTLGPATTIALIEEMSINAMMSPEMVANTGGRKCDPAITTNSFGIMVSGFTVNSLIGATMRNIILMST